MATSITYSFDHLCGTTRQLLPAVGLFHGVADADFLAAFSEPGGPGRFAGASGQDWKQALDDPACSGMSPPGAGEITSPMADRTG